MVGWLQEILRPCCDGELLRAIELGLLLFLELVELVELVELTAERPELLATEFAKLLEVPELRLDEDLLKGLSVLIASGAAAGETFPSMSAAIIV